MILDTRHLFLKLLATLEVNVVCDVGSLNGADALRFRAMRPGADVYAFEANPHNERRMRADGRLARARIDVVPLASPARASMASSRRGCRARRPSRCGSTWKARPSKH